MTIANCVALRDERTPGVYSLVSSVRLIQFEFPDFFLVIRLGVFSLVNRGSATQDKEVATAGALAVVAALKEGPGTSRRPRGEDAR